MNRKILLSACLFFSVFAGGTAFGQSIAGLTDEEGKIFLTDRSGTLWRCYATGAGSLPLQCRKAGEEEGEKIDVEKIESLFVEDKQGNKHPVKY